MSIFGQGHKLLAINCKLNRVTDCSIEFGELFEFDELETFTFVKLRWLTIGNPLDASTRIPINVKSVHYLDQTSVYIKTVDNLVYGINLRS